jgi:hypothetical protein
MNLERILEEWKKDSLIEMNALDASSVQTTMLHAKYLELYSTYKIKLKDAEFKQSILMKNKWLWFSGKLSKEEIDRFGWDYDPYEGLKILKGDMAHFVEADKELQESEAKIEYLKTCIDTLKDIMENLKWRHQNIRNIIEWKKFEAGF